jgi:hypothetical protein
MIRRVELLVLALALALAIALLTIAMVFGAVAARGWLSAFVLVSMVPIGSLALLLVHGISGGRWGRDLAPVLIPAARCIPLLFIAFLPVLIFRSSIYRWQDLDLPQDVTRFYLNSPFFDVRTLVALAIWSALAWCSVWRSELLAGLGLVAHLVLMTFIPADWILTLPPGSTSAGFGLGFGIEQMGAALAFAAVLAPQGRDTRADSDLAGLLVSTLLGTMYFVYMQFIVIWYGNIPHKVHWYAARADGSWPMLALAAFLVGAALPFLAILNPVVRREPTALRIVGILVLSGIALHITWLTAPALGAAALVPAVLAALAMALPMTAVARIPPIAVKAAPDDG